MSKLTKNQKAVVAKFESAKLYSLAEACALVKEVSFTKFDATVELSTNLGVDPRKANQMIRGVVALPHGTGKTVRVLVLCTPDKEAEAQEAGADYVGLDDYIEKIKDYDKDVQAFLEKVDFHMRRIQRVAGLFQSLKKRLKDGTITPEEVEETINDIKTTVEDW